MREPHNDHPVAKSMYVNSSSSSSISLSTGLYFRHSNNPCEKLTKRVDAHC